MIDLSDNQLVFSLWFLTFMTLLPVTMGIGEWISRNGEKKPAEPFVKMTYDE